MGLDVGWVVTSVKEPGAIAQGQHRGDVIASPERQGLNGEVVRGVYLATARTGWDGRETRMGPRS